MPESWWERVARIEHEQNVSSLDAARLAGIEYRLEQRRSEDPRAGTPDCDCGHSTFRHHGSDRSGRGYGVWTGRSEFTGCKDCSWCDYYKPGRSTSVASAEEVDL